MSDDLDPSDDPILQRLRRERPVAGPSAEVRAQHRQEVHEAMADAGRRRRPWLVAAAAAACVAVVGGAVLASNGGSDGDRQVATGENNGATTTSATVAPALTSEECGGTLPFEVPVPAGFDGPRPGPATGEPEATSSGQLVAHWSDGSTDIEVRWPAAAADPESLGLRTEDWADRWEYPLQLADADLRLSVHQYPDVGDAGEAMPGGGETYQEIDSPAARFEIAVAEVAFEGERADFDELPIPAQLTWGDGMCGVMQLTFTSIADEDVLPVAKTVYNQLIRPGGTLFPDATPPEDTDLVTARTEATELEPVTPCDGPVDNPTESTPVDIISTHDTADDALAAHLETKTLVDEGPFGTPETTYTVPTSGYTAISLSDGRIAYEFPDIVAYFIAEEVEGGWAITRYQGPTC